MTSPEDPARLPKGWLNPVVLLLAGLVFLAGVIPFGVALVLYQLYRANEFVEAQINARRNAELLLRSFEQTVEPIDSLLVNFANDFNHRASADELYRTLRSYSLPAAVIQLAVTDRDGVVIASSLAPPGGARVDLSAFEPIRTQMGKDPHTSSLFISKPVLGKISKRWTLQLTRPLGDAQGHFAGVVIASYAISDFIQFYSSLRIEEDMLIALVGRDGVIRARASRVGGFGDDVSAAPDFREALDRGGIYDHITSVDGVERLGYTAVSKTYPLVMVVAYSKAYIEHQGAGFRKGIWSTAAGLSGALLVVALLGGRYMGLLKRLQARELKAQARQREANVLDAISRVPGVAVMHVTAQGESEVGAAPDPRLVPALRRYLRSPRFLALAAGGLGTPHLRSEHLSDGQNELDVDVVVAPLAGMEPGRPAAEREMVVFAMDQTQRRLEEGKLYQMSKLASLGEVATGLAHEINQPLGVIRLAAANALSGMKLGLPPEHLSGKLERIIQQTVRMGRIIDHMRIFGRKSDERLSPSQPMAAVEGALQVVGAHFALDGIEIVVEAAPELPEVLCRQDQLEQVIINLLQNARDAVSERRAHAGGPVAGRITVRADCVRGEGGAQVRIEVADNGGGIGEEEIQRIFQPFFTTKPPGKGTGLGLSVSFGIVRDHGGSLSARNAADGAVFTILLPAVTAQEGAPQASAASGEKASAASGEKASAASGEKASATSGGQASAASGTIDSALSEEQASAASEEKAGVEDMRKASGAGA